MEDVFSISGLLFHTASDVAATCLANSREKVPAFSDTGFSQSGLHSENFSVSSAFRVLRDNATRDAAPSPVDGTDRRDRSTRTVSEWPSYIQLLAVSNK